MNYLFCFSKKAFKQNRQLLKLRVKLSTLKNRKKRRELIAYTNQYKNTVRYKINLNQWFFNTNTLRSFFFRSYFNSTKTVKKLRASLFFKKKQILLWFFLKNRFYRYSRNFLKQYTKTGVLSSHFVHILSRKNLTYQTRSKYRSKVFNLSKYNNYMYKSVKYVCTYNQILNSLLYCFTTNHTKKHLWTDEDFGIKTSSWATSFLNFHDIPNKYLIKSTAHFVT
jgi:hypothetical protein